MILTVTPNAALDITYEVHDLSMHATNRVAALHERAGGKGVNVASVLSSLGHPVLATGWAPGVTGTQVAADLDSRSVDHAFAPAEGEARRTITVTSPTAVEATVLSEPGPLQRPVAMALLARHLGDLVRRTSASVVVLSGSLPPGIPDDGYAVLVDAAHGNGAAVVLDATGAALNGGLRAHPDLVKPNLAELAQAAGTDDVAAGVRILQARGARHVVLSSGGEGMTWYCPGGPTMHGRLPHPLCGNPTGAGDAAVAALAAGLHRDRATEATLTEAPLIEAPLIEATLIEAVAWSAAAVLQPVAGVVDRLDIERLRPQVIVQEVP